MTTEKNKVLFVDDDANILASFKRRLGRRFDLTTVLGGVEGLAALDQNGPVAVVVSDQRMPKMDGVEFLRRVKQTSPDTVRIMLTGNTDVDTAISAVNEGSIFRFYTKPCAPETLADGIDAGLRQFSLATAEKQLLERTLAGSVKVLVDVLSLVDPEAFQLAQRSRPWMGKIAKSLGLENMWELDVAAMLAPIGLITVPDDVRRKLHDGTKLTPAEGEICARAPEAGRNLLRNIPRMQPISETIYYQNKCFDGTGFPDDWVAGEDIPVGARILRVLTDLLASCDPPDTTALAKFASQGGRHDPKIVEAIRAALSSTPAESRTRNGVLKVPVAGLTAGAKLVSNVETEDGVRVLAAGHEITQAQLEHLQNMHQVRPLKEPIYVLKPKRATPPGEAA